MGKEKKKKESSSSSSSSSDSDSDAKEEAKEETKQEAKEELFDEDKSKKRKAKEEKDDDDGGKKAPKRTDARKKEEEDLEEYKKRKIAVIESLGRTGGVYVPPFKLARLQEDIEDKTCSEYQRQVWDALRKSINGLVNKVNVANIKNLVSDLFRENLIRGRGVFARAILRAQMASPGFTHVYAAIVSVVNSKLPEVGDLIIRRVILQFRRAYKRNDKIVTMAAVKFMAHLVNQKVCSELLALHVATLLLERVTDDSIEVCVSFIQECGKQLGEISPAGAMAIFERFRTILHEGEIEKRVQYVIEGLFETRRKKFEDFTGLLEDLDLVDEEEQITHEVDLLDQSIKGEETLNLFKAIDPEQFKEEEAKWKKISKSILDGDDGESDSNSDSDSDDSEGEENDEVKVKQKILDYSEQDLVNLRRTIYLVIMSSVHFEECVHKILKLNITEGQEKEVCTMLIDCCAMERMYNKFFPLQAERLCRLNPAYQECFDGAFQTQFATVHRLETNKLRNIGKFFAHLLHTDAISWGIFQNIKMSEETTTSSSRIFIKIIFQELSETWGVNKLMERIRDEDFAAFFEGLFPRDHPKNIRFAINFFTAIGLGILTEDLRAFLDKYGQQLMKQAAGQEQGEESESESDSDSDSSSSSSSSS